MFMNEQPLTLLKLCVSSFRCGPWADFFQCNRLLSPLYILVFRGSRNSNDAHEKSVAKISG